MKAVNLLPSEQRTSTRVVAAPAQAEPAGTPPFGAYVVLGLLAFAVVAAALTVLASNTVKDRKAELARVTAEAEAMQARADGLQSYADFDGLATQRMSTVRGLATARFDWDRTLIDLSRALPDDVHLRSVDGSTTAGGGGGELRSSVSAPAINLVGCTTSQTSVARLMARLRNVRGVTRVALAQSQKAESTAAAPVPGANGGQGASLCPKGSPPDFDLTMFFERAALPAGAAVNPGAAGAAAAPATGTAPATGDAPAATASPGAAPAATPAPGATAAATPAAGATTTTSTQGSTP